MAISVVTLPDLIQLLGSCFVLIEKDNFHFTISSPFIVCSGKQTEGTFKSSLSAKQSSYQSKMFFAVDTLIAGEVDVFNK